MARSEYFSPDKVLYEFDEPLIFTVRFGPILTLALKIDEHATGSIYICAPISSRTLEAIERCSVSIRSAFTDKRSISVITTDESSAILKSEEFLSTDLNEGILPASGVALRITEAPVPDVIPNASALFSIYFRGDGLQEEAIDFARFAELTNKTFSFFRRMFLPDDLLRVRNDTFRIKIAEPVFGSLMFSVEEVCVDVESIKKRTRYKAMSINELNEVLDQRQETFFENISALKKLTTENDYSSIHEYSEHIDLIKDILPSDMLRIDEVHFTSVGRNGAPKRFVLQKAEGAELIERLYSNNGVGKRRHGRIAEINAKSGSFLLRGIDGRVTTCKMTEDTFAQYVADRSFKIGAHITVFGQFTSRQRRDLMRVESVVELTPPGDFQVSQLK